MLPSGSRKNALGFSPCKQIGGEATVGRNIGTQRREAGWEKVLRTKARLSRRVVWLADYFIQPTDIFLSASYVPDSGPGTEDTYTDKS